MEALEFKLVVIIENSSAQKYMFLLLFFSLKEVKWVEIGHSETGHVTILQFTFHVFSLMEEEIGYWFGTEFE